VAINKVQIGVRIRQIREEILEETREAFAKRCDLTERHVAQIERGEFLINLNTLDKIVSATGTDADYILYGKSETKKLQVNKNLHNIINKSDKDELQMYYKCVVAIKSCINKKEDEK
jgi:transcriptional regulator with XRE-family HTH domain